MKFYLGHELELRCCFSRWVLQMLTWSWYHTNELLITIPPNPQKYLIIYTKWNRPSKKKEKKKNNRKRGKHCEREEKERMRKRKGEKEGKWDRKTLQNAS